MGQEKTTKCASQLLREMEVGQKLSFPLRKLGSIKTMCTQYGLQWDKVFRTHVVAEKKIIEVTRIK